MKPLYLTFDCYGTLIDWKSGVLSALRDYPNVAPDVFFETWWQVDRRLTCDTAYRQYREVLALDFAEAFQSVGIAITKKKAEWLADGLGDWTPFPDAPAALAAFRRLGFKLGILSNIDNDLLERSVAQLGVAIDVRITAENIRSYKPETRHFEALLERTGLQPAQVLHIAASRFVDIAPASRLGFRTMYVQRTEPDGDYEVTPEFTVDTLIDAIPILENL